MMKPVGRVPTALSSQAVSQDGRHFWSPFPLEKPHRPHSVGGVGSLLCAATELCSSCVQAVVFLLARLPPSQPESSLKGRPGAIAP